MHQESSLGTEGYILVFYAISGSSLKLESGSVRCFCEGRERVFGVFVRMREFFAEN